MIRLQSALVANAAHLDQGGLISVLGGWVDTVTGPQLPVRQQLWLVARLLLEPEDFDAAHTITILIEHSDGSEQVARVDASTPPGPPPVLGPFDPAMPIGAPIVLPIPLEFRRLGLYYFRLRIDGDEVWSSPLKVQTSLPQM
jgi:hypothetical protein